MKALLKNLLTTKSSLFLLLIEIAIGVLLMDFVVKTLSPLGLDNLAISTWILLLGTIFLGAQAYSLSKLKKSLTRDLLEYDPEHFEKKELDKHFNEFAKKSDSE
jgi:hypothetical protein